MLVRAVLLSLAFAVVRAAPAQPVDTSGLPLFWSVHTTLTADAEPSAAAWDSLWRTPGYAMLDAKERRRAMLTAAIRLAYKPSLRSGADSAMRAGGWVAFVLPHLRRVGEMRDSLRVIEQRLASVEYFDRAKALAQEYLPAGTTSRFAAPPVSLIYFIDARGYERVLIDPLHFHLLGDPVIVMGHELHHSYLARVAKSHAPFGDDLLAWALSTTHSEGVAGLIDKRRVPEMTLEELRAAYRSERSYRYFEDYQDDYRRSNQWLAWTGHVLERVAAHPDSGVVIGRMFHGEIPDNGRIMGAFMAVTIERELGRDALLEVVPDPFAFWARYNDAARRSQGKAFVLSEVAMAVIDGVARRYAGPR